MENSYADKPFYIVLYDAEYNNIKCNIVILNGVPETVYRAVKRGIISSVSEVKWAHEDSKLLEKFYGSHWKTKIIPSPRIEIGGDDDENINVDDYNDYGELAGFMDKDITADTPASAPIDNITQVNNKIIYSNMCIFPDDSIYDIKRKITEITKIDTYRQHLFWNNDFKYNTAYKIIQNDVSIVPDIRCAFHSGFYTVAGLPINTMFEKNKDVTTIEDHDKHILLDNEIKKIYVVDLYDIMLPKLDEILRSVDDKYRRGLIYNGFVVIYWPEFTSGDMFQSFVSGHKTGIDHPTYKYRDQAKIMKSVYSNSNKYIKSIPTTSILVTKAELNVTHNNHNMFVKIRYIVDFIQTSTDIPYIVCKFKNSTIIKKHISAGDILEDITQPRNSIMFALRSSKHRRDLIYLTLHANGYYNIKSTWNESDGVTITDIYAKLSQGSNEIIKLLNNIKSYIFGNIKYNIIAPSYDNIHNIYGVTNLSVFWKRTLSSEGFKKVVEYLNYCNATGILITKGSQKPGTYSIAFNKGIKNFNAVLIDKMMSVYKNNNMQFNKTILNQYIHNSNVYVNAKWDAIHQGRPITLYHRVTDVKLEISNVRLDEFQFIYVYMFNILDTVYDALDIKYRKISDNDTNIRLKKLHEYDPDLYDIKKYDPNATVYSVLCQGERQPDVILKSEYNKLPVTKQKKYTKFWNFTLGEPAYYTCPSSVYPYLSFRSCGHPLGYCLPCCKKTAPTVGSKSDLTNNMCLKQHKIDYTDPANRADPLSLSKHIMSYSKNIDVGRLSYLPTILSNELFYNAAASYFQFRILGVPQTMKTINNGGLLYCISYIVELEYDLLVETFIKTIVAVGNLYFSLANGRCSIFSTYENFLDAFVQTCRASTLTDFSDSGVAADLWNDLLIDLVRIRFDIELVFFIDNEVSDIYMETSTTAIDRLNLSNEYKCNIALIMTKGKHMYPILLMDQVEFLKFSYGRGPARRYFSSSGGEPDGEKDSIVKIVKNFVSYMTKDITGKCLDVYHALILMRSMEYTIKYRLININNMCYGIVLEDGLSDSYVYMPVAYSSNYLLPHQDYEHQAIALYGLRPKDKPYSMQKLMEFMEKLRKYVDIHIRYSLKLRNEYIGFIAVYNSAQFYYYHDAATTSAGGDDLPVPYDPYDVDYAILNTNKYINDISNVSRLNKCDELVDKEAQKGVYKYNLYKLFVAEFAKIISRDRNTGIRDMISNNIDKMDEVRKILCHYPHDLKMLVENLDDYTDIVFGFDQVTVLSLREIGRTDKHKMVEELKKILLPSMFLMTDKDIEECQPTISNIYTSCADDYDQPHCRDKKLIISNEKFSQYTEILADTLLNMTYNQLFPQLISGIINPDIFTNYKHEQIIVK